MRRFVRTVFNGLGIIVLLSCPLIWFFALGEAIKRLVDWAYLEEEK